MFEDNVSELNMKKGDREGLLTYRGLTRTLLLFAKRESMPGEEGAITTIQLYMYDYLAR